MNEFLFLSFIHLLAVMSPGPDFAVVLRNSMVHTRQIGLWTSFGIGLGILVHVAYTLVGIGFLISKSILLFSIIKTLGALYLLYLGWKMLRSKSSLLEVDESAPKKELTPKKAVYMGFLTNVLNPKATLFFVSVFTQVISPETSSFLKLLYGLNMCLITMLWFGLVSFLLTGDSVKTLFNRAIGVIEKCMGVMLTALGLKILVSRD